MKKQIIFVLLAVLTISFASIGFAAAKKTAAKAEVTKKEAAKPAAEVNPLLGKWSFAGMQDTYLTITFAADKVIFNERQGERGQIANVEMKYKFSKSPVILEHKTPEGKIVKLSMKYTVKGSKLTYRFLNMNNKPIPGLTYAFSMDKESRTANPKDADIVAEKQGGSAEETSAVAEQKSEKTSDKPAETKKDDKKPADVVLIKGVRLRMCNKDIKENGTFTMENVWIAPVKSGKFDIILPAVPDFGAAEKDREFHFFRGGMFRNSGAPGEYAGGLCDMSVTIVYSEKDGIKNSDFTDKPVTFKKGWNIIGNKTNVTVEFQCRGRN